MSNAIVDASAEQPRGPFYVQRGAKVFGPFTVKQIVRGSQEGKIRPKDLVSEWASGPWRSISTVVDLSPVKAAPTAAAEPAIVAATIVESPVLQPLAAKPLHRAVRSPLVPAAAVAVAALLFLVVSVTLILSKKRTVAELDDKSYAASSSAIEQTSPVAETPADVSNSSEQAADVSELLRILEGTVAELAENKSSESATNPSDNATGASDPGVQLDSSLQALEPDAACDRAVELLADGQERSLRLAFLLFDRAARMGNSRAMFYLSGCYKCGFGTGADDNASNYWIEQSALKRYPEAMFWYAGFIQEGLYPGKGQADCQYWLSQSAQEGYEPAVRTLEDYRQKQVAGLIGAVILSGFSFGGSDESSDTSDYDAGVSRRREREYWSDRARRSASAGDMLDAEFSSRQIP